MVERSQVIIVALAATILTVCLVATVSLIDGDRSGSLKWLWRRKFGVGVVERPLSFVTLMSASEERPHNESGIVAHNCRLVSSVPGSHTLFVYTDDLDLALCQVCSCRPFSRVQCPCSQPSASGDVSCENDYCNQLEFFHRCVETFDEFVHLDPDVILLKETFVEHLYPRTRVHNFLATFAHEMLRKPMYWKQFSTGIFFMRRLPNIDYSTVGDDANFNSTVRSMQEALTHLIHSSYDNWDSLSLKFHCRRVIKAFEIPPSDCYTVQDNVEGPVLLANLNQTFSFMD